MQRLLLRYSLDQQFFRWLLLQNPGGFDRAGGSGFAVSFHSQPNANPVESKVLDLHMDDHEKAYQTGCMGGWGTLGNSVGRYVGIRF